MTLSLGRERFSGTKLPADFVKGKRARAVILNDCAQAILERVRGEHRRYVFTSKHGLSRRRLKHVIASSWHTARMRASQRYRERFGVPAPEGFQRVRVHDLRHYLTFLTMSPTSFAA
jgi:integrase